MLALTLLTVASVVAQVPQGFNYQAVVRNAQGELVSGATVGVRISLLQGSETGTVVFSETHNPQTNAGGLFTIVVGQGDSATGNLTAIDWANGPYFISTEVDPEGGSNYTINSVQQLLSVPYAMYAGSAANAGDVTRAYVDSAIAAITIPAAGVTRGYVDSAIATLSMTGGATVVYDGERDTVVCGDYDDWYGTDSWIDLYVEAGIMHFYTMNYTILRSEYHDTTVVTDSSSYVWHGETYTSNGSYYWYSNNTTNCVVEHLNLFLNASYSNVIVTFGNDTWTAQGIEAYYETGTDAYFGIWASNDDSFDNPPMAGAYSDGIGIGSHSVFEAQYYLNNVYNFDDGSGNTIVYGDWVSFGNGTANFTMFDMVNNRASGTITTTLYSLDDYVNQWSAGNEVDLEQCSSRQLTITFTNVPMEHMNAGDTTTVNPEPQEFSATMTFNGEVYEFGHASATYYSQYQVTQLQMADHAEGSAVYFPYLVSYIDGYTVGSYNIGNYAPELYMLTYYSDGNGYYYGDWQYYDNYTATITSVDVSSGTISGTMSATMYSLTEVIENEIEPDEATHRQITVQFNNIPFSIYDNSTSSAAPTTFDGLIPQSVLPQRAATTVRRPSTPLFRQ